MTGFLSRSDFYRILLPGAIVVALTVLSGRLLIVEPQTHADGETTRLILGLMRFIEDPVRGFAIAFSVGLVLYFFDLGYASPEYQDRLPSKHLRRRLVEAGFRNRDYRDVYFQLLNEYMSEDLRQRALLYGSFFRIGTEMIAYMLLAGSALPVLLILYATQSAPKGRLGEFIGVDGGGIAIAGILGLCLLFMALRRWWEARRSTSERPSVWWGDSIWLPVGCIFISGMAVWRIAPMVGREVGSVMLLAVWGFVGGIWLLVRMRGSLVGVLLSVVRGTSRYAPVRPYPRWQVLVLDASLVTFGVMGIVSVSNLSSLAQSGGMALVLLVGLMLSYFRKHERQHHGIGMNQEGWIDRNFALVERVASELGASRAETRGR